MGEVAAWDELDELFRSEDHEHLEHVRLKLQQRLGTDRHQAGAYDAGSPLGHSYIRADNEQ